MMINNTANLSTFKAFCRVSAVIDEGTLSLKQLALGVSYDFFDCQIVYSKTRAGTHVFNIV